MSAARGFSHAVRPVARQLTNNKAAARRTFVAAMGAATTRAVARPAFASSVQQVQTRGVKTIDFAGVKEDVYGELSRAELSSREERPIIATTRGELLLTLGWCRA